jgi:hypothetical protein
VFTVRYELQFRVSVQNKTKVPEMEAMSVCLTDWLT